MGAHRSGAGAAGRVLALIEPEPPGERVASLRPAPARLYGRQTGHRLRARQALLLERTLPRLRLADAALADPRAAFGAPVGAVRLEIGFGAGEHALSFAAAHPDDGLIASEVFSNGLASLLGRLVPPGGEADAALPDRFRVWDRDARLLLAALPDASLDGAILLFPDPWPKARHAKRRFVHPANVALLARVLRPGAEWRIASDDPTYQAWVASVMHDADAFVPDGVWDERPPGWPPTRYERKAAAAGREPRWWRFRRV